MASPYTIIDSNSVATTLQKLTMYEHVILNAYRNNFCCQSSQLIWENLNSKVLPPSYIMLLSDVQQIIVTLFKNSEYSYKSSSKTWMQDCIDLYPGLSSKTAIRNSLLLCLNQNR
eukprot:TRINITY_DN6748_c0_g1_i2.p3 TRINITY_DN6748_c0_g1~~TRINITY_DN6748_c0_g1_i2.p3  ORF type:complete len:115 (-),score=3.15 TRINITY_DN6748_c0_g1_i2:131-475(-)